MCLLESLSNYQIILLLICLVYFLFIQNVTLNYDTSGVGQNGVPTAHMLPAATLAQYSRHYGQAVPGYTVPGTPWVTPYVLQTGPPHMQQVDVSHEPP